MRPDFNSSRQPEDKIAIGETTFLVEENRVEGEKGLICFDNSLAGEIRLRLPTGCDWMPPGEGLKDIAPQSRYKNWGVSSGGLHVRQ